MLHCIYFLIFKKYNSINDEVIYLVLKMMVETFYYLLYKYRDVDFQY